LRGRTARRRQGRSSFQRTEREVQNAGAILFTAHHLDGPVRGRAERNAALVEVIKAYGDLAMTKREKGLNGRKVRMGRLVEAEMALICGKVITWFVGCRL